MACWQLLTMPDDTVAPAAGAPKLLGAFFGGAGASAPAPKQTFGSGSTGFASLPAAKESVATSEAPTLSFGSKTDSSSSSGKEKGRQLNYTRPHL